MLSNVRCLVTGASSGIGKSTCQVLTKSGATVIGTGRNEPSLQELKADGHIHDYIVADLTGDDDICKKIIDESIEKLGGTLTTLVNNAGVLRGGAMGAPSVDVTNYDFNMNANVRAPFQLMVHAIPHLRKAAAASDLGEDVSCSPSIINISSVNGKQSFPGCVSYCMSKAAVDQLTRCASIDLAPDGIRVNSINPGLVVTNLQKTGGMSEEAYEAFLKRGIEVTHPLAKSLGRVAEPSEVGELIAFLVSDKAKFITGECIAIDGGRQNLGAR